MVRRGVGWGAWFGVCLVLGAAGRSTALELRRLDVRQTPSGAAACLELSAPVRPTIHGIEAGAGRVSRLYVDLPARTRVGPGAWRVADAARPVTAVRVGVGEKGVVRIVVELGDAAAYRVRRAGRTVTVSLTAEAPPVPLARAEPAPPPTVAGQTKIVLDPGHGGQDPGAEGFAIEKEVTLAIAAQLASLLHGRLGAAVVLTRSADVTLPLAERTARANAEGADLFVSIHANASRSRQLHGIETYYLNNTQDRATIRLAAMENGLDLITPAAERSDLRYILSDLVQVGKMEESVALATAVQRGLVAHLATRYRGIVDLGVKRGPFYVLVGAYMPCVLVETSFLTHPAEGRRLAARPYRAAVAEGIYAGIARFLMDARRARTL